MTPQVSVIVPVYNGEAYLAECLDSLLAQTLPDMEILLVDDGSADGTQAIAEAYAARDARLRYLRRPHAGVSAARNAGLDEARGAYIGFCDADDTASPDMYERLYQTARARGAQVSFCAVIKQLPSGDRRAPLPWPEGTVFDRAGIRAELVPQMIAPPTDSEELPVSGYTPRNLFQKELLVELRFREDLHYAEDLLFIVTALLSAERAAVVADALYTYRFHGGSTTKRYVAALAREQSDCHGALEALFAAQGIGEALAPRMAIRKRSAVLAQVANLCRPGTPYGFGGRCRRTRDVLRSPEVRALFAAVPAAHLPVKLRVKYRCIKMRLAWPLVLLFSYVSRSY